jgi:DNA-binding response OmpR family regulator
VTAEELRLDGLSVLVLEDEYILAEDAARVLRRAGARVIGPFQSIDEGLTAALLSELDCALLDLNLGAGLDFAPARALRALGVPVVFFSGYDADVIPADFSDALFLQKPFHMPMIVDIVAKVCSRTNRTGAGPALRDQRNQAQATLH